TPAVARVRHGGPVSWISLTGSRSLSLPHLHDVVLLGTHPDLDLVGRIKRDAQLGADFIQRFIPEDAVRSRGDNGKRGRPKRGVLRNVAVGRRFVPRDIRPLPPDHEWDIEVA